MYPHFIKPILDFLLALFLILLFSPIILIVALLIRLKLGSPIFFIQERPGLNGKIFKIYKFRTMSNQRDSKGQLLSDELRLKGFGKFIRKSSLDELPQLFNVLKGEMSFVGTRPEVPRYVQHYTAEMYATLLLPAGVTSEASIEYKDEERLLSEAENADEVYINKVLPEKMRWNYSGISKQGIMEDIKIMLRTMGAVV